ncbi:MAG: hypothetical protein ACKODX_06155 [Gemmata sp.]
MRRVLFPLTALFFFAPAARADDAADAKAIIEKAVKARGPQPAAQTWKDRGKFTGGGFALDYAADWAFEAPDKYRFTMAGKFGELELKVVVVVNGEKAWESDGSVVREITGEKLEYARGEAYQFWVTALSPLLNDNGFALATAPGKDVAGKPAVGVKVTREKKPAITLYFDKGTGLLVKTETRVRDEFQKWKEVLDEAFFSDYKEADKRQVFTTLRVVRDGKPLIESTLSDQKGADKLDAKLFEKP